LFTGGGSFLFAASQLQQHPDKNNRHLPASTFPEDTITKGTTAEIPEISPEAEFSIPDKLANQPIDFQVNSEISYFRFSHFVNNESKEIFYKAWLDEKVVNILKAQTDSLRKAYANSSSDRKEAISDLILKAEERSIALNEEIPVLYEKARDKENLYWQSVTAGERMMFQEKIKLFQDSIRQISTLKSEQTAPFNPKRSDTITYYKSSQSPVLKKEVSTGIIYKIEIGAYKGKVPYSAGKSIKKLSILRQVENYTNEDGVNVYTTGNLKKYEEAVTMQNQVKQEGIKNAAITAYKNGKKISVNEARKLNKEL